MDRRSMIGAAVAALTGAAAGAKVVESHQDETAVFILHLSEEYGCPGEADMDRMQKVWKKQWEGGGLKPPVLLITAPGMTLVGEGNAWMSEALGEYSYQIIAKNADEAVKMKKAMERK